MTSVKVMGDGYGVGEGEGVAVGVGVGVGVRVAVGDGLGLGGGLAKYAETSPWVVLAALPSRVRPNASSIERSVP